MSEPGPGIHVLIVDDDPIMGELLDALLSVEGYRVTRALTGAEAIEVARDGLPQPGIILCDIQMPGMRGGELALALARMRSDRVLPADSVILAMSGSSPHMDELHAFDGCLRKPFSVADFTAAVEEARTRTAESLSPPANASAAPSAGSNGCPAINETIFEQLRSKVGNDSLRQLYDMTLDDVRSRLERIADAAERGDEAVVRQEAHTIKGSCGMVGAQELQALAAATEGGSPIDTCALADFDSACQRLERMLNEKL